MLRLLSNVSGSGRTVIAILNWNNLDMTAACVRSLLVMDRSDFEIVVVDNGSGDNSPERLSREFPKITVLPQRINLGFAGGCNIAMRHSLSTGAEYVLVLNNDTYVAADFLSEMLSVINKDNAIGAVCPKIYFAKTPEVVWYAGGDFDPWTSRIIIHGWKQIDRGQFVASRDITLATGCAMLIRCSALSEVGLFDEKFWAYVEDLDLSLRLRRQGYRLVYVPKARVWHWDGSSSVKLGSGSHAVSQYLSTRNLLFLARKHLRWWQVPTFTVGFVFAHVVFFSAVRLWRGDYRALSAVYRGLGDGLRQAI